VKARSRQQAGRQYGRQAVAVAAYIQATLRQAARCRRGSGARINPNLSSSSSARRTQVWRHMQCAAAAQGQVVRMRGSEEPVVNAGVRCAWYAVPRRRQ